MHKFLLSLLFTTFSVNLFSQTQNALQLDDAELQALIVQRQKAAEISESLSNNLSSINMVGQINADSTWVEKTGSDNPLNGVDIGSYAKLAIVDIDNDGDNDVFVGSNSGYIYYYKNTGSKTNPVLTKQETSATHPLHNTNIGAEVNPTFVDIDGDGDFDLFNGITAGTLRY